MKSSLLREGNRRDDCSFSIFMSFRDHCFLIGKRFAGVSARYLKKKDSHVLCILFFVDRNDRNFILHILSLYRTLYYKNAIRKLFLRYTRDSYTYFLKVNSFEGLTMIHK